MVRRTRSGLLLALLGLVASQAQAIPVNYSISGSGIYGSPVGSFTCEAPTNLFSNVYLWSVVHFTSAIGSSTDDLLRATGAMGTVLRLAFSSFLSDGGGTLTHGGCEPGATFLLVLGLVAVFLIPRRRPRPAGQ